MKRIQNDRVPDSQFVKPYLIAARRSQTLVRLGVRSRLSAFEAVRKQA